MIVDLFAGPGGWDVGLWMLGGRELVERCLGVEWDAGACATRREAGLRTLQGDVAVWRPTSLCSPGMLEGLIASPPCKAFSKAGKREGIEHAPALARAILEERWDFRPVDDPLVWLALEVAAGRRLCGHAGSRASRCPRRCRSGTPIGRRWSAGVTTPGVES